MSNRLDPAVVVFEREVFVGRVRVFIRQTEADQNAGNLERIVHLRDEGNGAAFAYKYGLLAKSLLQCGLGDVENRRVISGNPRFARAQHFEFAMDAPGQ